jgi:hypothetical protein
MMGPGSSHQRHKGPMKHVVLETCETMFQLSVGRFDTYVGWERMVANAVMREHGNSGYLPTSAGDVYCSRKPYIEHIVTYKRKKKNRCFESDWDETWIRDSVHTSHWVKEDRIQQTYSALEGVRYHCKNSHIHCRLHPT